MRLTSGRQEHALYAASLDLQVTSCVAVLALDGSKPDTCCKCSIRLYQTLTHDLMPVIQ